LVEKVITCWYKVFNSYNLVKCLLSHVQQKSFVFTPVMYLWIFWISQQVTKLLKQIFLMTRVFGENEKNKLPDQFRPTRPASVPCFVHDSGARQSITEHGTGRINYGDSWVPATTRPPVCHRKRDRPQQRWLFVRAIDGPTLTGTGHRSASVPRVMFLTRACASLSQNKGPAATKMAICARRACLHAGYDLPFTEPS